MRAMIEDSHWLPQPPALAPALLGFVTEQGSLTERLLATGHRFAVQPLYQGAATVHPDEALLLGIPPGSTLYARQVLLTLDDTPVVYARSIARLDCPVWQPILDRGSRSLGFTLFGGLPQLQRAPLHYRQLDSSHPLYPASAAQADSLSARRCRFVLDDAPMVVCEVFLPALKDFAR
ncbi:chorismate--pyruvate lyase family protein [Aquitalea magnusonii]|jgi:chorismate--pyruvate lyase|uniref:chorismate--pyruvate lyase family protein n=1 Tax=Aquitalea magnusonii TaxID=332411 RepID=UPI000B5C56DD|nr:chorismate lyase [Aquitalea magnusonii]